MKSILFSICLATATLRHGAQGDYSAKTATGTTAADVIFPGEALAPIRLVSLDVKSDLSSSKLVARSGRELFTLSANATNATNFVLQSTSGLASNHIVVFQRRSDNAVFKGTVWSVPNSTNLNLAAAITATFLTGDQLYLMTNNVSIDIGAATVRQAGEALFLAARSRPLLLSVDGTSACIINNAVAHYGP
ncbi:MAG TPA: hypothetical protein VJW76_02005 [Verrucomicrobiae bacterium]|nr:hypothetical protein [Verrucomicrobiae bacterium]